MSQRQLAQQSGVDHSTISRLIAAIACRPSGPRPSSPRACVRSATRPTPPSTSAWWPTDDDPTARVEYSLRADEVLTEPQVRQIMEYYLALRMRRFGRVFQPAEPAGPGRPNPSRPIAHAIASVRRSPGPRRGSAAARAGRANEGLPTANRRSEQRPLLITFHDVTWTPSTSGSRGQRTPVSGPSAFAISGAERVAQRRGPRLTTGGPDAASNRSIGRARAVARRRRRVLGRAAAGGHHGLEEADRRRSRRVAPRSAAQAVASGAIAPPPTAGSHASPS